MSALGSRRVLNFCANNYLGLSDNATLKDAAKAAIDSHGLGLSSVRFICGTQDLHKALEARIAAFHGADDAILYASCLPEHDTRVLTDHGFLFLSEIEALEAQNVEVRYASYDTSAEGIVYRSGVIVYAYTPGVDNPASAPEWVDFTQADTRRAWDDTSDDYGSTRPVQGECANRLTVRTTPNHKMFVQLCMESGATGTCKQSRVAGGVPIPPHLMQARELIPGYQCDCSAAGRACTHGYSHYRMCTGAEAGLLVAPADVISLTNHDDASPVVALLLRSEDALDAFLTLFGYWLGDGTMDYSSPTRPRRDAVVFSPKKVRDRKPLLALLDRLHLVRDVHYTRSPMTAFVFRVRIKVKRWFRFFDDEFGVKYEPSRHYNRQRALLKHGMHRSQAIPRTPRPSSAASATRSQRSASSASSTCELVEGGSTTTFTFTPRGSSASATSRESYQDAINSANKAAPEDAASCLLCGTEYDLGYDEQTGWQCAVCVAEFTASIDDAAAQSAGEWSDQEVKSDSAMAGDWPAKDYEPPTDDDTPMKDEEPPIDEEPPTDEEEDDPVKLGKWLPDWVLFRLNKEQLRVLIEGLRQVDGHSTANQKRQARAAAGGSAMEGSRKISTSCVGFRDQLVQACLHAGYSAYFTINTRAGRVRGYNAKPGDGTIYTPEEKEAALLLDPAREFKEVRGNDDNWWVCYNEEVHALLPAQDIRFDGSNCVVRKKKAYGTGWVAQRSDGEVRRAKTMAELAAVISCSREAIESARQRGDRAGREWRIFSAAEYEEQSSGQAAPPAAAIPTQAADLYDEQRDGRVWCVQLKGVKDDDRLILVQRAHRNERGVVTKVGRTTVVGNCFDANAGLFETMFSADDCIISDALNHASIIDGIRLSKARRLRYAHLDMAELEAQLRSSEAATARHRIIVSDGVFSMDGHVAPLQDIVALAQRYDALTFIDECHATGFFGNTGKGTDEYCGVQGKIDIINSTLGQ